MDNDYDDAGKIVLPTESEARAYWASGRTESEAREMLMAHCIRSGVVGTYYPGMDDSLHYFSNAIEPTEYVFYYLPGQKDAALAEAARHGIHWKSVAYIKHEEW